MRRRAGGVSSLHSSRDRRGGCWECCLERPTWSEPEEFVLEGQVRLGFGEEVRRSSPHWLQFCFARVLLLLRLILV